MLLSLDETTVTKTCTSRFNCSHATREFSRPKKWKLGLSTLKNSHDKTRQADCHTSIRRETMTLVISKTEKTIVCSLIALALYIYATSVLPVIGAPNFHYSTTLLLMALLMYGTIAYALFFCARIIVLCVNRTRSTPNNPDEMAASRQQFSGKDL